MTFSPLKNLDSHQIKAHLTQMPGKGIRGVKNTIAIGSGKGGVGKSTLAVNLACALAKLGARVGLLDADIYGPSVPLMLGNVSPLVFENEHYTPVMVHGITAMSIAYLTEGEPALMWRGPMLAKALIQMLDLTLWDNLDFLFIDLPPGTGDIQLSLVQKIPLAGSLIITTPQTVATQDADKAIKMFKHTNIPVLGIVENMAHYTCRHCNTEEAFFNTHSNESLYQHHEIACLGSIPLNPQISHDGDKGTPTVLQNNNELSEFFLNIAEAFYEKLATRPLNYTGKFPDIVVE